MGQTSDPETLVIHQKLTPGNNPKTFKQRYDHGGSLQLHIRFRSSLMSVSFEELQCPQLQGQAGQEENWLFFLACLALKMQALCSSKTS
jgi:hypothetical protein